MKLTYLLILFTAAVFVAVNILHPEPETIFENYGFSSHNLVERPYVLVTSIFLHGSLLHLLSNALAWFFFGVAVEGELKKARMLAVFFLGAFAGDALSLLVYPPDAISVGASAGIFALVGAGMLLRPMDLSMYPLVVPLPLALLGLFYAIYNVLEFFAAADPTISYIAHIGGLAVGVAFGFRYGGLKRGLRIIAIALAVLVVVPLLWIVLT